VKLLAYISITAWYTDVLRLSRAGHSTTSPSELDFDANEDAGLLLTTFPKAIWTVVPQIQTPVLPLMNRMKTHWTKTKG
jgi:hypothetical protein